MWGLQQAGIAAVIASGFGEIFYSNAFNNRLLLVMLPQVKSSSCCRRCSRPVAARAHRLDDLSVRAPGFAAGFTLAARQREMFRRGLDMIGLTLTQAEAIAAFARRHHAHSPWLPMWPPRPCSAPAGADGQGGTQEGPMFEGFETHRIVVGQPAADGEQASPSTRWSADRGRRFCCCTGIRRRM